MILLEGSKGEGAGCLQQPSLTKDVIPVAEAAQAAGPERGRRQVLHVSQGAGRASAASARDDAQHRWKSGTVPCTRMMQQIMQAAGAGIAAAAAA